MISEGSYDVAVIGGGPAGASSAYYAAKAGLKTILFEKSPYPREKPCGGALPKRNLPLLGKHAAAAINCNVNEIRVFAPSYKYFSVPNMPVYFILRSAFDHAMAKDALEAGAVIRDNCPVTNLDKGSNDEYQIKTTGGTAAAHYVIMASGPRKNTFSNSLFKPAKWDNDYMAACAVSETPIDNKLLERAGFPAGTLSIFFGPAPNAYAWLFVKAGYLNIGTGSSAVLLKGIGATRLYNDFVTSLKEKGILPKDLVLAKAQGFPLPYKKTANKTVFEKVLLVGDAAGFVSPISGEGIYYAIQGGKLAVDAIVQNIRDKSPLSSYHKNCLKSFGTDLNQYGLFLRERLYKSKKRMELAVTAGRYDLGMAEIIAKFSIGLYSCKQTKWLIPKRIPATLFNALKSLRTGTGVS
ncbi:MAG: NAD(P)/FAD-dependent oxidoreductase [bacterium]|nr:NAD(P)/FAD-dependent oxidoreductase [bacterium]